MSLDWIPPWIEIAFSGAVALGFGLYQIWSVNREIAKDKAARDAASSTPPGHAEGEHELHDG